MADREKVKASLSNALVQMHGCGRYTPEDVDELETAAWGALKLLEEQEAKRVEIVDSDGGKTHWYVCGRCKAPINPGDRFCHECGRVVKWDV